MSTRAIGIDVRPYRIALIQAVGAGFDRLGWDFVREWLPVSGAPTSADLVEGTYTRRMGDAGEFSLTFPNAVSSGGFLWREKFNPDGALQFVEISHGYDLEFVGLVERVELDRGSVRVSGSDAWALTRRAYERDRYLCNAPRDVIYTYSKVPRLYIGDEFDDGVLSPWTSTLSGPSGGTTVTETDGVVRITEGIGGQTVTLERSAGQFLPDDGWRFTAIIRRTPPINDNWYIAFRLLYDSPSDSRYELYLDGALLRADLARYLTANPTIAPPGLQLTDLPTPFTVTIEGAGRWVRAFVNGQLVSYVPQDLAVSRVQIETTPSSTVNIVEVESVVVTGLDWLLQPSFTPMGDPRLPGGDDVYPRVGLRARFFSIGDLAGRPEAERRAIAFRPDRESYGERLDAFVSTTDGLSLPLQGFPTDWFAVRWTGAVWLDGGSTYRFHLDNVDDTATIWVGNTRLVSEALEGPTVGGGSFTSDVFFDSFSPWGSGWYPIIVEYQEWGGGNTLDLRFTPSGPTYTDPGGTSITSGVKRTIPTTSLTPIGIYENRVQGQSHFDLMTSVAREFGYEMECTPKQLEAAQFPGVVMPVRRLGRDTDVILRQDELERETPLLSPGSTIDASEQAIVVRGNAKGLNIARGGDLTAEVVEVSRASSTLFMLEGWIDAGDVGFTDLLQARMLAELGLRVEPWQEVRGNPHADDRLVDTWPLTDTLSTIRWLPGDGVRLLVPDVGIEDSEPRRITQLVRSFSAEGRNGAQVSFRNRPRSGAVEVRRLIRAAIMPQRQTQESRSGIQGEYVSGGIVAGGASGYSRVPVVWADWPRMVRAYAAVVVVGGTLYGLEVNGVDRTTALGGPWQGPASIDFTSYAKPGSTTDSRVYLRVLDKSGAGHGFLEWQGIVEVAR